MPASNKNSFGFDAEMLLPDFPFLWSAPPYSAGKADIVVEHVVADLLQHLVVWKALLQTQTDLSQKDQPF